MELLTDKIYLILNIIKLIAKNYLLLLLYILEINLAL